MKPIMPKTIAQCVIAFILSVAHAPIVVAQNSDEAIPTPASVLGWPVGTWHATPHQIETYFKTLDQKSDRATLEVIGYSHQQKPLINLVLTSPENQKALEQKREAHLNGNGPLVVWLVYGVHGNETSGSQSAMLVAHQLAASNEDWIKDLLEDTIVIIHPVANPDGLAHAATWFNMHRGKQSISDPIHRIRKEMWPNGRFNHYWFDMNRDWLPATQPESVARLKSYYHWQPHIVGDFHEHGRDRGYFFQPGVPSRTNPLTPQENQDITAELAKFHADALDALGQRYFTRERFDDFYYGKASSFADATGAIGILFEQACCTGGASVETQDGIVTFKDGIENQVATSFSTLKGAHAMRDRIITYRDEFFKTSISTAEKQRTRAWVIADEDGRAERLLNLLKLHQIDFFRLGKTLTADAIEFKAGQAWIVPAAQRQAKLIQSVFETRTQFDDNTFYDVSAWNLPMAQNLPFAALRTLPPRDSESEDLKATEFEPSPAAVAYAITPTYRGAPAAAVHLLNHKVRVYRVSAVPARTKPESNLKTGDFVIPIWRGTERRKIEELLSDLAKTLDIEIRTLTSGLDLGGLDLGSLDIYPLKPIKPVLLTGAGVAPDEAGFIWHFVDLRLHQPLTLLDMDEVRNAHLDQYTHILLPDLNPSQLPKNWQTGVLEDWVKAGGTLIAQKRAATWAQAVFSDRPPETPDKVSEKERIETLLKRLKSNPDQSRAELGSRAYHQLSEDYPHRLVKGTVFEAQLDMTHPIALGYTRDKLPIILDDLIRLKPSPNAYNTPLVLNDAEPVAGFASAFITEELGGLPMIIVQKKGNGTIIQFAFDPNFRAFWHGTELLYSNALLNAPMFEGTKLPAHRQAAPR